MTGPQASSFCSSAGASTGCPQTRRALTPIPSSGAFWLKGVSRLFRIWKSYSTMEIYCSFT